jgi:tyrosinase
MRQAYATKVLVWLLSSYKSRASANRQTNRHDWKDEDKKAYLAAQQCVMGTPAKLNKMPGAKTRWDELVGLHQLMALQIHSTGQFLPFHRYLLHGQQYLLSECGYTGPLPYWDETRDAGKFASAPVFDSVLGFGGNGQGAKSCVPNGPFSNFSVNIGPGFKSEPRCVNRKITNALSGSCGKKQVQAALNNPTYEKAWVAIYNGPHLYGHMALSMMVSRYSYRLFERSSQQR